MIIGLTAMEKPEQTSTARRVYFVMNNTSGVWVEISNEYSRISDAVRALEELLAIYPFARLGGARLQCRGSEIKTDVCSSNSRP
jgi:hypothetical protein